MKRIRPLRFLVVFIVIIGAVAVLYHQLSTVSYASLKEAFHQIAGWRISASMVFAVVSFAGLAAYDVYACNIAMPGRVSVTQAAFAGAVGNAVSNTLGFHAVTGGVIRYRFYAASGATTGEIAKIVSLTGAGVTVSFAGSVAISLLAGPPRLGGYGFATGIAIALMLGLLLYWLSSRNRALTLRGWTIPFPKGASAVCMMIIGIIEMGAAIGGLYVLLPDLQSSNVFDFALLYIGAIVLGVLSGAPGGAGVFEAAILTASPGASKPVVLAALLMYRLIYNILPFAIAIIALFEHRRTQ